ncbi:MAG TPA: TraB/GumN family protein [Chthoniobacterales bacterium]
MLFLLLGKVSGCARWMALLVAAGCFTSCAWLDFSSQSGKSTLWRVKGESNTVYLMGSVHILPKAAYPLKPAMNRAFRDSQRLVFEIPLGADEQEKALRDTLRAGLYPKGETLSENLTPETLAMLKGTLPYFNIPLEKLEPIRPWLVSDLLLNLYLEKQGYSADLGIDMYFLAAAQKSKKPISALETVRDQTVPFAKFSDRAADTYLRDTLSGLPFTVAWFRQMAAAWRGGDVPALEAVVLSTQQKDRYFHKTVFTDRNDHWMPAIRGLIGRKDNYLVIVGAGHLVGQEGVVEQLRRAGFRVEQM